jgi:hypothetical protein
MVENAVRKSIPGRDANLPPFIVERMEQLGVRPTLTHLALGVGVPKATLGRNLSGSQAMRLETAIKLADFLRCNLNELVQNAGLS